MKRIERITSSENQQLKLWKKLKTRKGRKQQEALLIEGEHLLEEAIGAKLSFQAVIFSEIAKEKSKDWLKRIPEMVPVYELPSSLFNQLVETATPQGMAAVVKRPEWSLDELWKNEADKKTLLLIDSIQDPGNLGTLIRTAKATGMDGIFLGKGTVDPFNGKVVRASMGAIFKVPLWQEDLELIFPVLKERKVTVVNTSPHSNQSYFHYSFPLRTAILLGNEGRGVNRHFEKYVDDHVTIPMPGGTESLNVSITGALLMYERIRQRSLRGAGEFDYNIK